MANTELKEARLGLFFQIVICKEPFKSFMDIENINSLFMLNF